VYPAVHANYETASHRKFGDGAASALSTADVRWFHTHYVNAPEELALPYVSPLRAESLTHLPPALLICASADPLLDDNTEYVKRLQASGVPVELRVYPGMFHGFTNLTRLSGKMTKF
jgi:acetyl esterase